MADSDNTRTLPGAKSPRVPLRDLPADQHPMTLATYSRIDGDLENIALRLEDLALWDLVPLAEVASEAVGTLWRAVQTAEREGR